MSGLISNKFLFFLAGLVIATLLLFPAIKIADNFPVFQFVDFLLPFITIFLFVKRKEIVWNRYFSILGLFLIVILISIVFNNRLGQFRDYFELYKIIKFSLIILLFSFVSITQFTTYFVKPVFIILCIVNLFHYFNFFNINSLILSHFNGGIHIKTFGLNSLGQSATRRMIGLSGNPNINSIVFSFFTIVFFPSKNQNTNRYLWFVLAIFMMFLCQSRTNLIAFVVMVIATILFARKHFNSIKIFSSVVIAYLASFFLAQNAYLNSLFGTDITQNTSLLGRIEVWKHLWEMIKKNPIIGHGPNKEYFYDNTLYAESEYVLHTWRYGIIGLLAFLNVLFYPVLKTMENLSIKNNLMVFQFTIMIAINSLTNNPFSDRFVLVLFAMLIGLFFNGQKVLQDEK